LVCPWCRRNRHGSGFPFLGGCHRAFAVIARYFHPSRKIKPPWRAS
jgi:hypothetical protein